MPLTQEITMSGAPSLFRSVDDELRAHAGAVVNQLRNEFRAALGLRIANRPVPVKHGGPYGSGSR